jgi:hypothetical protein
VVLDVCSEHLARSAPDTEASTGGSVSIGRQIVGAVAGLASLFCVLGVIYSIYGANRIAGDDAWGETFFFFLLGMLWFERLYQRDVDGSRLTVVEGEPGPRGPAGPPGPAGPAGPAGIAYPVRARDTEASTEVGAEVSDA